MKKLSSAEAIYVCKKLQLNTDKLNAIENYTWIMFM